MRLHLYSLNHDLEIPIEIPISEFKIPIPKEDMENDVSKSLKNATSISSIPST